MRDKETVQAGKATITRSQLGAISFLDKRGNRKTIYGDPTVNDLFEAIRDGSGEPRPTIREDKKGYRPLPGTDAYERGEGYD